MSVYFIINEVLGFLYGFEIQVVSTQRNSDLSAPWKAKHHHGFCFILYYLWGHSCWINLLLAHNILLILIPKWLLSPTKAKCTTPCCAAENISLFIIKCLSHRRVKTWLKRLAKPMRREKTFAHSEGLLCLPYLNAYN